ncbi:hypothetical protein NECID01_1736 [Nematocida sp. AWRm77]|nr:hypothetical protein NECID01_1736 [Nematocida sp. AWRm77]
MLTFERVTQEELAQALQKELALWEKKKETVQKWGEHISMTSALAPTAGHRVNMG